jgi:hypothetical protein
MRLENHLTCALLLVQESKLEAHHYELQLESHRRYLIVGPLSNHHLQLLRPPCSCRTTPRHLQPFSVANTTGPCELFRLPKNHLREIDGVRVSNQVLIRLEVGFRTWHPKCHRSHYIVIYSSSSCICSDAMASELGLVWIQIPILFSYILLSNQVKWSSYGNCKIFHTTMTI